MKHVKLIAIVVACALCFSTISYAGEKNKNGNKEGKKVPIDGGISLLVVAGAAFGVKKVFQANKKSDSNLK